MTEFRIIFVGIERALNEKKDFSHIEVVVQIFEKVIFDREIWKVCEIEFGLIVHGVDSGFFLREELFM